MATIQEWNEIISRMSVFEIERYLKDLNSLENWDFFANEYENQGIFFIRNLLKYELNKRGIKK